VLATRPCSTSCGNRVGRSDTTLFSAFSASAALIAALTCCNSFAHPASSAEASRQASFATAVTVPQHDSLVSAQFLNGASHSDKQSRRCLRLAVNLKRCSCTPCRSNSTLPLNAMISFAIADVWWRCGAANDFLRGGVARTACCNSRNFDSMLLRVSFSRYLPASLFSRVVSIPSSSRSVTRPLTDHRASPPVL